MASEAEVKAAATVIAREPDMCSSEATPPCVPEVGADECICMRLARQALDAAERVREPVIFTIADGSFRCTVNGPQHIVVERAPFDAADDAERP